MILYEQPAREIASRPECVLYWRQHLAQRDPENPSLVVREADAHDDLALALDRQNKIEEALVESTKAVNLLTGLTLRLPSRFDWQEDLAIALRRRGDMAFESKLWKVALADYDQSQPIFQRLTGADPGNLRVRLSAANLLLAQGETLRNLHRMDEAKRVLNEAEKAG